MALQAFLDATNRLLQNPVSSPPLYTTSDLTYWINLGRQQVAADAQCVRATSAPALSAGQNLYGFSIFQTFPLNTTASGSVTFNSNPANLDTVTLNGFAITFVTGAPVGNQVQIGPSTGVTIGLNLMAFLNTGAGGLINVATFSPVGGPDRVVLQIAYKTPGSAGNTFTLAASVATVSGPTLTGGGAAIAGIAGVIAIRQMSANISVGVYRLMTNRPYAWANRYWLANGSAVATGIPTQWSQQGVGATGLALNGVGSFVVNPTPTTNIVIQADCVCIPANLTTDSDPEVIPYPWTEAVPFYAAMYAYLSSQRTQDATTMFARYSEFVKRGVDMTAPPVLPDNFQGGLPAQILGTKQQVTVAPQPQQGR